MCGGYETLTDALQEYGRYGDAYDISEITGADGREYAEIFDKSDDSTIILTQGSGRVISSSWMFSPEEVAEWKEVHNIPVVSPLPQVSEQTV